MTWLLDGKWSTWVKGDDADRFLQSWRNAKCLCTYNGKCFDEAFICKQFGLPRHHCHLDLRYPLAKAGIKGGLKKISTEAGFPDHPILGSVDGWLAIELWELASSGSQKALETLICYNALDVARTAYLFNCKFAQIEIPECPWKFDEKWAEEWLSDQPPAPIFDEQTSQRHDKNAVVLFDQYSTTQPVNLKGEWYGSVISFTGKMLDAVGHPMLRKEARLMANAAGFAWVDEVVHGCTHLVAADGTSNTRKSKRAHEFGISVVSPKEFWEMIQ